MNKFIRLNDLAALLAERTGYDKALCTTFINYLAAISAATLYTKKELTIDGLGCFFVKGRNVVFTPDPDTAAQKTEPAKAVSTTLDSDFLSMAAGAVDTKHNETDKESDPFEFALMGDLEEEEYEDITMPIFLQNLTSGEQENTGGNTTADVSSPMPWEQPAQPASEPMPWEQPAQPASEPMPWEQPAQPASEPMPWEQPAQPASEPMPWEQPAQPASEPMPWEQPAQPAAPQPSAEPMPWEQPAQPASEPMPWEQPVQPASESMPWEQPAQPAAPQPSDEPMPWEQSVQPADEPKPWGQQAQPIFNPNPEQTAASDVDSDRRRHEQFGGFSSSNKWGSKNSKKKKKRIITGICVALLLAVAVPLAIYNKDKISGIWTKNEQTKTEQPGNPTPQSQSEQESTTSTGSDGQDTPQFGHQEGGSTEYTYDTVSKTRTIAHMAKEYYGHKDYWVYIYLDNTDKITNPTRITAGTKLRIPPRSNYDVSSDPKENLKEARKLGNEVLGRFINNGSNSNNKKGN